MNHPHTHTILHNNLHRKETSASQWHLTVQLTVHKAHFAWYMLNFSGSLILQISQSFRHLRKYFNENFLTRDTVFTSGYYKSIDAWTISLS